MSYVEAAVGIGVFVISVSIHEAAHGWTAWKLGDPTAKNMGRVTLNPLKHIDPMLSIVAPGLLYLSTGMIFGAAKGVPFDPSKFRPDVNPKRGIMWVAAAGPISNFIQAFIAIMIATALPLIFGYSAKYGVAYQILHLAMTVNLLLAIFNLIPFPPLDGSKILSGLLPDFMATWIYRSERYWPAFMVMLFAILYLTPAQKYMLLPLALAQTGFVELAKLLLGWAGA